MGRQKGRLALKFERDRMIEQTLDSNDGWMVRHPSLTALEWHPKD
jgi:hypothetical protein